MKKNILLVLALFLITGIALQAQNGVQDINVHQADSLIKARAGDADFIILDVRTDMEFSKGHIENAKQLNFLDKKGRREIYRLDKDKAYLIYCRTAGRTGKLSKKLKNRRFKEVYNMVGGIRDWTQEGYPIVENDSPTL